MGFSLSLPVPGQPFASEGVKVGNDLSTISIWANGNIAANDLGNTLAQSAAVNTGTQTIKGATNIATAQATGSTTFTTLATPDQVNSIVLPANGLIAVWYQATWFESAAGAASAAIFLGSNQLKIASIQNGVPTAQAAAIGTDTTPGTGTPLASCPLGLATLQITSATPYGGDVTTGQAVGVGLGTTPSFGPCYIFAAAGSYAVSVQFKASSGTVTAQNRKLWVQALSFA